MKMLKAIRLPSVLVFVLSMICACGGGGGGGKGGGGTTTYSISGTVSAAVQAGVTMTLTGAGFATTTTDASGNYSFTGLSNGSYVVTPSLAGYIFTPNSSPVTISGADVTGVNFTAAVLEYLQINIDGVYAVSVVPPGNFSTQVQYAGIDAKRAFSDVDVGASLNAAHDTLTLEIHNTGGQPIKRLWAIAVESISAQLDNPDSINKLGQPVIVFGPYAPAGSVSRDITIQITAVPATIQLDLLEVNDRIAYSSSKDRVLYRRIWTIDQAGTQPYFVDSGATGDLMQTSPTWSPGMEWIAYDEVDDTGISEIYIMHPDGGSRRPVSPLGRWSEQSSFTPSGKNLVYSCIGRVPGSSSDICVTDLNGSYETDLVRGDGYYWDGIDYQPYPSGFLYNQVYSPRLTPDGQHILFTVYDADTSPSPVTMLSRMYLYDAPFDPVQNELTGAPRMLGSVINSDTIATATGYVALAECLPSFSADGQSLFCFLKEFQNTSSWVQSPAFYGLAKIDLPALLSAAPNAYIGDYIKTIYDIRAYRSSQGAGYLNFQDYSPDLNSLFFCTQYTQWTDIDALDLEPLSSPRHFISDTNTNYSPKLPPPMISGFYQ